MNLKFVVGSLFAVACCTHLASSAPMAPLVMGAIEVGELAAESGAVEAVGLVAAVEILEVGAEAMLEINQANFASAVVDAALSLIPESESAEVAAGSRFWQLWWNRFLNGLKALWKNSLKAIGKNVKDKVKEDALRMSIRVLGKFEERMDKMLSNANPTLYKKWKSKVESIHAEIEKEIASIRKGTKTVVQAVKIKYDKMKKTKRDELIKLKQKISVATANDKSRKYRGASGATY